ncbi:methyltransferase domain-containing protein [Stieleria sp. TO1_6]|uniref:class I SAM-dependent DNA methyltransferase n=1 Tax=Stieleria tagensis TaxID=2956795 RepID=UPI00209B46C3|nr:methyltransferase [Stieleria tagensis]MCO8120428.1 methyltransferase domain-containing protein [Stieleria tagensis]
MVSPPNRDWQTIQRSLAGQSNQRCSAIETVRQLKRQGHPIAARTAASELVAGGMLSSRDLVVFSDQCRSLADHADWQFYRRLAYQIEMSQLGLTGQDLDDSVDYCLAGAGVSECSSSPPQAYIRAVFDRYSTRFDERLVGELDYRGPSEVQRVLRTQVGNQIEGARLLDIGCGTGLAGPLFRSTASLIHGIDLSPQMIQVAQQRGVYDALWVGEIVATLSCHREPYEIVLAIDVLVYFGDLVPFFAAVRNVMAPGAVLAVSVEKGTTGYQLAGSRRYVHGLDYVRSAAAASGMRFCHTESVSLRKEAGKELEFEVILLTVAESVDAITQERASVPGNGVN